MKNIKMDPDENIIGLDNVKIGDFWAWAYSDVLSNINRSIFAEFIVGNALGVIENPRVEWDSVDLKYKKKGIEVKSSAYIQSWGQDAPSKLRFDIGKKREWNAETNTYSKVATRSADFYVFCFYSETDETKANILNIHDWRFFIISTESINQEFGEQKSIGIKKLQSVCKCGNFSKETCTWCVVEMNLTADEIMEMRTFRFHYPFFKGDLVAKFGGNCVTEDEIMKFNLSKFDTGRIALLDPSIDCIKGEISLEWCKEHGYL